MKLSNNRKDELRKEISNLLTNVHDGNLVKIDKDTLEDLLFETIIVSKKKILK